MKGRKIIIKGAYGDGNIGDDLLLEIVYELLIQNNIDPKNIFIVAKKAPYLKLRYNESKFLSPSSAKYENSDYFLLGGGTQFFSFGKTISEKEIAFIYLRIFLKEPGIIFKYFKSKLKRRKESVKIALGIGLGPFRNSITEINTKIRLEQYSQIFCRDYASLMYCNKWNVNAELTADLCLTDLFKIKFPFGHKSRESFQKIIGVVIRDWSHNEDGNKINRKLLAWIENQKEYTIKLFLFSEYKDALLLNNIKKNTSFDLKNLHIWIPEKNNFTDFLEVFNSCDIIATTRYHAAIFAVNFLIPSICIGIDPKLKFISEEVDGFCYLEIDEIDHLDLLIRQLIKSYKENQDKISLSYNALNQRANLMIKAIQNI